jgi:hypothetical protein
MVSLIFSAIVIEKATLEKSGDSYVPVRIRAIVRCRIVSTLALNRGTIQIFIDRKNAAG